MDSAARSLTLNGTLTKWESAFGLDWLTIDDTEVLVELPLDQSDTAQVTFTSTAEFSFQESTSQELQLYGRFEKDPFQNDGRGALVFSATGVCG